MAAPTISRRRHRPPARSRRRPPTILADAPRRRSPRSRPGYTATLPGSLIEDVLDTEVAGISEIDSAWVELLNSLTPYGANAFLLNQLGQIYIGPGSAPAVPTNTSVEVVFQAVDPDTSAPLPGQVIPVGFTVSDGTYQYVVQDGGVTGDDGNTIPLFCTATVAGSWAVPTNTVTQLATSAPPGVTLTCTNPEAGVSGGPAETEEQYRARVIQAGQAITQGMTTMLKTLVGQVPGVQQRLISVRQQPGGMWEVIVGGGDPYLVAGAVYDSGVNIAGLVGSTLAVTNITQAEPGRRHDRAQPRPNYRPAGNPVADRRHDAAQRRFPRPDHGAFADDVQHRRSTRPDFPLTSAAAWSRRTCATFRSASTTIRTSTSCRWCCRRSRRWRSR